MVRFANLGRVRVIKLEISRGPQDVLRGGIYGGVRRRLGHPASFPVQVKFVRYVLNLLWRARRINFDTSLLSNIN